MKALTRIGDVEISRTRPYLILEAGVNHEGSLETAFEMIDAAAETGADMIKFQSYKAENLASRHSPAYWDRSREPAASQFELFSRYDKLDASDYVQMAERCEKRGIAFASTPFDDDFVDLLDPLMTVFKIASADLTNFPLLRRVASKRKPVLLSTGASHLSEVEETVRFLDAEGVPELAILHCTLEYPTPAAHANLNVIPYLQRVFPTLTVGWSDHVPPDGGTDSLLVAWMLGADVLEKHFTLDKTRRGNDHYHALDPDDVKSFVARLRRAASMLGDGTKTVPPGEAPAREFARRSLVVTRNLPEGAVLAAEDLAIKRPGTGIAPRDLEAVIGATLHRAVEEDEILVWSALSERTPIPGGAS